VRCNADLDRRKSHESDRGVSAVDACSNGFTSEVPFGLVDTGATDAVGFDVLPYPLVGVEFRRVSRELEQAQLAMGRSHEVFDCFGPVNRMAVDNEKYRATGVVHQSLAEVDEVADSNIPA